MKNKENLLTNTNPALWFVLVFIILLLFIIAFNFDRFDLKDADLFTFFYTYLLHTFLNRKRFRLFNQQGVHENIYKSYLQLTWYCLPYLLIAVVYENLILFSKAFEDTFKNVDLYLMMFDEVMFGVQPTIWLQKLLHPLAVDYFMVAYGMFFVYPFVYIIYLLQKNRLDVFYRVLMAQVISLIISLSCYILFPAIGPRFVFDPDFPKMAKNIPEFTSRLEGIKFTFLLNLTGRESFYALQYDMWNYLERIKTDCMPSMHVCLCLICLIYAMRYRETFKWEKTSISFWVIGVFSLIISTVYLRYHWVIDIIAGIVLTIMVYFATEMIYLRWASTRKRMGFAVHEVKWIAEAEKLEKRGT
ncbi:MAG: phosphatase PAP2 family protein [Deltaproteobacteria bacterium]|nr:phosphatase PAP2 family protein [Deltaproteobacteria bacterium]